MIQPGLPQEARSYGLEFCSISFKRLCPRGSVWMGGDHFFGHVSGLLEVVSLQIVISQCIEVVQVFRLKIPGLAQGCFSPGMLIENLQQ